MSATGGPQHPQYAMVIEWLDEVQAHIVSILDFPDAHRHGATYEEAAKQGKDLIDSRIMWMLQDGKPVPQLSIFAMP